MRGPALILLCFACALSAAADTVYLRNGRKFEQVVAEREAGGVRIRFSYGEMVLPANIVARVELGPSVWQEYEQRERRLRAAPSTAADWLELARWADGLGYRPGMEEAVFEAAAREPQLEGVVTFMRRLGYVHDRDSGEWLTEGQLMRRRGYELWGDQWVPREVYLANQRRLEEAEQRRREAERQERIARAIEVMAVAQVSRTAAGGAERGSEEAARRGQLLAVFPGTFFPFLVGSPPRSEPPPHHPRPEEPARFEDLMDRQPGSIMPLRPVGRRLRSDDGRP